MNYSRILPAAAGIIALTAILGFSQEKRENEEEGFIRTKISMGHQTQGNGDSANLLPLAMDSETGSVYFVEIQHGKIRRTVTIDAYNGKVLGATGIAGHNTRVVLVS